MFYDIFSKLCEQKGIRPSKAAEECGINKSNVSNWKNNGYVPRSDALNRISNFFDVSIDYLLGNAQKEKASTENSDKPVTDDPLVNKIIEKLNGLSPEHLKIALEQLDSLADSLTKLQDKKDN